MWTTPGTRQQQPHTDYMGSPCHFLAHLMHPQYRAKQDRDGSSVSVCCFETLSLILLPPLASFVCWRVEHVTPHLAQLHAQLRQAAAFQIARGRVRACRLRCANFVAASANHLCFVTVRMRHFLRLNSF
jgi:hypothetical protein